MHSVERWQHSHDFLVDSGQAERRTARVIWLTLVTMVIEIVAGTVCRSMALLADGWHMATHLAAFGIAVYAYRYARRHAGNPRYTFGTGKVSVLGGFASAVALAVVALVMALESVLRLFSPQSIQFNEAILVAVFGLLVNVVGAVILSEGHDHEHEHEHHHHDHALRASYAHVLADALTSVFAIVALLAGKYGGWLRLDPVMGLVGATLITHWAYGLLRDTSAILLDGAVDEPLCAAIRQAVGSEPDNQVADLHVWSIGPGQYAAALAVVTHQPRTPEHYKALLAAIPRLAHVLVEVNPCDAEECRRAAELAAF
jgi:cation diffusion facilitator family transporter